MNPLIQLIELCATAPFQLALLKKELASLKYLDLSDAELSEADIINLCDALKYAPTIDTLIINTLNLSDLAKQKLIEQIRSNTHLVKIQLLNSNFTIHEEQIITQIVSSLRRTLTVTVNGQVISSTINSKPEAEINRSKTNFVDGVWLSPIKGSAASIASGSIEAVPFQLPDTVSAQGAADEGDEEEMPEEHDDVQPSIGMLLGTEDQLLGFSSVFSTVGPLLSKHPLFEAHLSSKQIKELAAKALSLEVFGLPSLDEVKQQTYKQRVKAESPNAQQFMSIDSEAAATSIVDYSSDDSLEAPKTDVIEQRTSPLGVQYNDFSEPQQQEAILIDSIQVSENNDPQKGKDSDSQEKSMQLASHQACPDLLSLSEHSITERIKKPEQPKERSKSHSNLVNIIAVFNDVLTMLESKKEDKELMRKLGKTNLNFCLPEGLSIGYLLSTTEFGRELLMKNNAEKFKLLESRSFNREVKNKSKQCLSSIHWYIKTPDGQQHILNNINLFENLVKKSSLAEVIKNGFLDKDCAEFSQRMYQELFKEDIVAAIVKSKKPQNHSESSSSSSSSFASSSSNQADSANVSNLDADNRSAAQELQELLDGSAEDKPNLPMEEVIAEAHGGTSLQSLDQLHCVIAKPEPCSPAPVLLQALQTVPHFELGKRQLPSITTPDTAESSRATKKFKTIGREDNTC